MARILLATLASFDYTLHVGNTLAPSYNKEVKGGLLCNAGPPARQTVKLTPADAEAECVPLANRLATLILGSVVNTTGWYTGIKLATNGTPTLCTASSQPRCESALDGATGSAATCSTFDAWNVQQPSACHASSCRQLVQSCSDSNSCNNVKAGPTMLGSTCYDLWQGECIRRPIKSGTHHVACGDEEEACFPSSATVTLSDGTSSRIDALKEGDKVVAATSNGTLVHDTVSILSIVKPEAEAAFVTLTTVTNESLTLTLGHHVPVGAACCSTLKLANDVSVGETVWAVRAGQATATVVSAKVPIIATGLHSPVLVHGGFPVVDGVVTAYDTIERLALAKYSLAPALAMCKASGTCDTFRELFLHLTRSSMSSEPRSQVNDNVQCSA